MSTDSAKIAILEERIVHLQRQMSDDSSDMAELRKEFELYKKKIHTAETWGRALIWVTLMLVAAAAQVGSFVGWLKKAFS